MIIIETLLANFITMSVIIYMWHKLSKNKINFKSNKIYFLLLAMMIFSLINYYTVNAFLRIVLFTVFLMVVYKLYFNETFQKSIITPLLSQIIVMISEMIFGFVISVVFNYSGQDIVNTQFGTLFSNLLISILNFSVVNIPFTEKLYKFLLNITDKLTKKHLIIITLLTILIANMLTMILYYKIQYSYLIILNSFTTIFFFSLVLYSFKTKNNYNKVTDKYNTTLNSLKEYETILERYRILNHENKNELLTIRNIISKTNKKAISYIDTIVENKQKDNEKIMLESTKIPEGGLRGLIYSKIITMKDSNINYKLDISKKIKTVDLINKIDDSDMLDICKVIGVYLDNAIQEVEKSDIKNIYIEMYMEDNLLIIAVSNNFLEKIELNLIEQSGYTSKGNGHGYGLTLAKEIIEKNNRLSNEKRISKKIFTQILKIKM